MGVLRWWFTLNYEAITVTRNHRAFAIRGPGVKVLSENERLAAGGQRVHTGQTFPRCSNQGWAASFTPDFEASCAAPHSHTQVPRLWGTRNLFDVALTAALLPSGLPAKAGWHLTCFGDPQPFPWNSARRPRRWTDGGQPPGRESNRQSVVFVSGGVCVEPAGLVAPSSLRPDTSGTLNYRHARGAPRIRTQVVGLMKEVTGARSHTKGRDKSGSRKSSAMRPWRGSTSGKQGFGLSPAQRCKAAKAQRKENYVVTSVFWQSMPGEFAIPPRMNSASKLMTSPSRVNNDSDNLVLGPCPSLFSVSCAFA